MNDKKRIFKLGFPLKFMHKESDLYVTDNLANDAAINLDKLESFEIKSIDSDGFVLFEVNYSKSPKLEKPIEVKTFQHAEAGVNGYTLFHSSVALATSYGYMKSIYEYYKRNQDLSYYALIKKEGTKPTKITLGSMNDANSRIHQVMEIIHRNFDGEKWFDRKDLSEYLPSPLNNGRILKCIFDILIKEDYLEKDVAPSRGRKGRQREILKRTKKLDAYMIFNSRSLQKTNGASVSQLSLTSN